MAKGSEADPLERWRHFEAQYAEAAAAYLRDGSAPTLDKDALVELVGIRTKADKWRERYYAAARDVT